jgi:hypothetical protein
VVTRKVVAVRVWNRPTVADLLQASAPRVTTSTRSRNFGYEGRFPWEFFSAWGHFENSPVLVTPNSMNFTKRPRGGTGWGRTCSNLIGIRPTGSHASELQNACDGPWTIRRCNDLTNHGGPHDGMISFQNGQTRHRWARGFRRRASATEESPPALLFFQCLRLRALTERVSPGRSRCA